MFSLLWAALIGLIIGAIAKLIMPGKDPGGWIITMLLGLAGSFVASYLGRLVGWYKVHPPDSSCPFSARFCCCIVIACSLPKKSLEALSS